MNIDLWFDHIKDLIAFQRKCLITENIIRIKSTMLEYDNTGYEIVSVGF